MFECYAGAAAVAVIPLTLCAVEIYGYSAELSRLDELVNPSNDHSHRSSAILKFQPIELCNVPNPLKFEGVN